MIIALEVIIYIFAYEQVLPIKKRGWVLHMCSVVTGEGGAPNGAWDVKYTGLLCTGIN